MTPALLVEFGFETLRQARIVIIAHIANGARQAGAAAGAGVIAFPRSIGMVLTNPSAILAE
jgi:hypothetical protein